MKHDELKAKTFQFFRKTLEEGKRRRSELGPFTQQEKTALLEAISMREMDNQDYWQLLGKDNARAELDKFCAGANLPQPTNSQDAMSYLGEVRKAQLAQFKALLDHGLSLDAYDFSQPRRESQAAPSRLEAPTPSISLKEAVTAFLSERSHVDDWTTSTTEKRTAILDIALEWFGEDIDMGQIGKPQAAELKEAILKLPANRFKLPSLRGLTLRDAIEVSGVSKISNATVNSYLSTYKNFWKWSEAHGYAPEALFEGLSVPKKTKATTTRRAFTQEALEKTYEALTDPNSKFSMKLDFRWATLIAMFTGARLNEVCQLQLDDLQLANGMWVFNFTEEGDPSKRLKSSAAERIVPVHSKLIELGLLDFVKMRRTSDCIRFFPSFTYTDKAGYGDKLSKWFNRTFAMSLGIKSKAHVFHGLRHTFTTRLAQADVETPRIQFIVGHEREGVTHQVYFKEGYSLRQTKEAVEKFSI